MWLGPLKQWRPRRLQLRFGALEWAEGPEPEGCAVLDPMCLGLRVCDVCDAPRAAECLRAGRGFELRAGEQVLRFRSESESEDQQWVADIEAQLAIVNQRVREQRWSFVRLHVYHFGEAGGMRVVNFVTEKMLHVGGIFHAGLEVHGREFSYGASRPGTEGRGLTGAFICEPQSCRGMRYHKTVHLGITRLSKPEVVRLLKSMQGKWLADDYDLTAKNCISFCRALSGALAPLGPGIPAWVDSLARNTARLCSTCRALEVDPVKRTQPPTPAKDKPAPQLPSIWQAANQNMRFEDNLRLECIPDLGSVTRKQSAKRMPHAL